MLENYKVLSDDKKMELIKDIKDEAQWLIRIVENILSITRINQDGAHITTELEVVEEIVGSAVQKFGKRFPDVEISVHIPDEVLMVPMDAILIEQVLVNLMENSVIHGKSTQNIEITIERQQQKVLFTVEDDGEGISDDVLPEIFEGGLHKNNEEELDGGRNMGIGLSVCMSIIKAHNGNMHAGNKKEGGACMTFYLPMEEEVQ